MHICNISIFLIIVICFTTYSNAIMDRMFTINTRLPRGCGHYSSYKPQAKVIAQGEWPWLGVLSYKGISNNKCHAILIHEYVAITALTCVKTEKKEGEIFVEFSTSFPAFQQKMTVNLIHSLNKKIALLKFKRPVISTEKVQPICAWEENNDYSSEIGSLYGVVIGTEFKDSGVYQAPAKVIRTEECKKRSNYFRGTDLEDSVCLNYFKDPIKCHYFGSALVFPRINQDGEIVWYLRGIQTQRVYYCENGNVPSFDLAKHRPWIESHFEPSIRSSCGRRFDRPVPLVTNGYEANRGDWPWHVAITLFSPEDNEFKYHCGGSLIDNKYIVTAAHCLSSRGQVIKNDLLKVILGKTHLTQYEDGSVERNVSRIIPHEQFVRANLSNDIGMIEMSSSVEYNDYIKPVCLWDGSNIDRASIFNQQGKVPGWGRNENFQFPTVMNVATMPIVSDADCLFRDNLYYSFLTSKTLCAGNPRGNRTNVCNGDSGGGLVLPVLQDDNVVTWYLRGIVSLTKPQQSSDLCDPDYYAIFTDSVQYLDWIRSNQI